MVGDIIWAGRVYNVKEGIWDFILKMKGNHRVVWAVEIHDQMQILEITLSTFLAEENGIDS